MDTCITLTSGWSGPGFLVNVLYAEIKALRWLGKVT